MKRFLLLVLFATACATTTVPGNDSRERVDLIIAHGTVVPIVGANIKDGAVAVANGKIIAVGSADDIGRRYIAAETIDGSGSAILPGFVNTHTHVPMTLFRGIADDRDLMDWLQHFIFPAEAKNVDAEFVRVGTRLAAAEMIGSGTTTFADMYYFESDLADETAKAGLRGVLGETVLDFPAPDNKSWDAAMAYSREFIKRWSGHPLITPAIAPHAPYTVSADHLRDVRRLATELHAPILIHVAEPQSELEQVAQRSGGKTPVQYLDSLGLLGPDVVAAHSIWVNSADIATLASTKTGVAHCPESNMMLASGVAPVVAMRAAGVHVGLGTDGPAGSNNNLDMIEEMASAARLQKITTRDPKALSARAVLEMATIEGARVLGLSDRVGSIEAGKQADLIVIDLSGVKTQPVFAVESAVVYAASGSNVTTTIVDGKVLMRDHRVLTVDVPDTLKKAEAYRVKILQSLAPAQ
jgi:5-methylthioadenosine/S-adenosylhomocysteine deaminase